MNERLLSGRGSQTRECVLVPGDDVDDGAIGRLCGEAVGHGVRRRHEREP